MKNKELFIELLLIIDEMNLLLDTKKDELIREHGNNQILNIVLYQWLKKKNIFDVRLHSGFFAVGINNLKEGVIQKGINDENYHCWIYVPDLELIIDATLRHLQDDLIDKPLYELSKKIVVHKKEIKNYHDLVSGEIGYYYKHDNFLSLMINNFDYELLEDSEY